MILQSALQSHSVSESLTSVPREPVFYSVLSQINDVKMTKDSHSAAGLALDNICSVFSRCTSRVSDVEWGVGLPKM